MTFTEALDKVRSLAPYVADVYDWDSVVAILSLELTNTDCLPAKKKAGSGSKSTQIELTDSPTAHPSKTDDFFPILHRSQVFPSDQMSLVVTLLDANIALLEGAPQPTPAGPTDDRLTIQHRAPLNATKNPSVHLGFDGEMLPLRNRLGVGDFIVFLRFRTSPHFLALGFPKGSGLPSNKGIYVKDLVQKSVKTRFTLGDVGSTSRAVEAAAWWISPISSDPNESRPARISLPREAAVSLRLGDCIILCHKSDGARFAHAFGTVASLRDEGEHVAVALRSLTAVHPYVGLDEPQA